MKKIYYDTKAENSKENVLAAKYAKKSVVQKISEAEFMCQVIEYAHLKHYRVAHFRSVCTIGKNGKERWMTPVQADGEGLHDLLMVHPKTGRVIFAELKAENGRISQKQVEWLGTMTVAEAVNRELFSVVWRPSDWDEIESIL